jgi:FixJ family two-component response regulator
MARLSVDRCPGLAGPRRAVDPGTAMSARGSEPAETVLVVDDDALVARTIANVLGSVGIATVAFRDPRAFLDRGGDDAGCVLMDVRLPGMSGTELLRRLRAQGVELPVIVMTGHAELDVAVTAFRAGAFDFLKKPFAASELIEMVQRALERGAAARRSRAGRAHAEQFLAALTPREREVLPLLVAGMANKEIGRRLGISHRTAEHYRQTILKAADVRTVVELAGVLRPLADPEPPER